MRIVSKPWTLLRWNIGCAALCLGLAGFAVSPDVPSRISLAELREMTGGIGQGTDIAVNAQTPAENPCYYCINGPLLKTSHGCFDAGQVLKPGIHWYSFTDIPCHPVSVFQGPNCTGMQTPTMNDCLVTKPIFVDP